MTVTQTRTPRLPYAAARLRLPLYQRTLARMRERYGFDLSAGDALDRARSYSAAHAGDAEGVLLVASVLATRGDMDQAETEARRAVEMAPDHARAHTTLATVLVNVGRQEEGLRHARRAAELDAEDPSVLFNLGMAERVAGDRRAAADAFWAAWAALERSARPGEPVPRRPWWRRRRG